jgi:hypothetical protein
MSAFCTQTDIENLLQLDLTGHEAAVTAAIVQASAYIQAYTEQVLEQVEDDEVTFDGPEHDRRLFLPELPVTEVGEVAEDGEALVLNEDYKLGAHGILWRIGVCWSKGIQNITVTYSHGYATIPEVIAAVCTRVAGRIYQAGQRAVATGGVAGVQSMTLGDYSVAYATGGSEAVEGVSAAPPLLPTEMALLDRYAVR